MSAEANLDLTREAVLAQARLWIGTPYQHQCSQRGAGCDCLGLIRGVWRVLYGLEPLKMPAYTLHWAEETGEETLYQAASECLLKLPVSEAKGGDVLLFRMAAGSPAKHVAILSAPDRMIHAYWGRSVVETLIIPYWQRRLVAAFSFPTLLDS